MPLIKKLEVLLGIKSTKISEDVINKCLLLGKQGVTKFLVQTLATDRKYQYKHFFINREKRKRLLFDMLS